MRIPLGAVPPVGAAPAAPPAQPPAAPPQRAAAPATPPVPGAPPAAPPPPAAPQSFKVRYNHQDLELAPDEAQKYIQIGLKAQKLDERQRALEAQARQHAQYVEAGRLLEQVAKRDPRAYQVIEDAVAGHYGPPPAKNGAAAPSDDDAGEGLTQPDQGSRYVRELEQRLLRLEAATSQVAGSLNQRDYQARLDQALNRPYLRANPEAAELARDLVPGMAEAFEGNLDAAAAAAEARAKRLIEGYLERERAERESRREASPVNSLNGGPPIPRLDPTKATYASHRSGQGRSAIRELMAKFRAGVSGPNT